MMVGSAESGDSSSNFNTIENNIFYYGGHHLLEIYTKFNVVKNNYFHNEGFMEPPPNAACSLAPGSKGLYGNRNLQIWDGYDREGLYNLIENNRFGETGCPPDDNGGSSLVLASSKNIARYNFIFKSAPDGIYFKQGWQALPLNNRVYNNTIYKTGIAPAERTALHRNGISLVQTADYNVIKNNLIYDVAQLDISEWGSKRKNTIEGNWTTDSGNPLFADTDISNPFNLKSPDLSLKPRSPCIDRGIYLTTTKSFGDSSKKVIVLDALYFQDGTWGSSLAPLLADWIAVETISNIAQIASVDYKTNTITLTKPLSWRANAKVWLYKDSSGRFVLKGGAPDVGADESNYSLHPPKVFFPEQH
jgi:hypothetical protein